MRDPLRRLYCRQLCERQKSFTPSKEAPRTQLVCPRWTKCKRPITRKPDNCRIGDSASPRGQRTSCANDTCADRQRTAVASAESMLASRGQGGSRNGGEQDQ